MATAEDLQARKEEQLRILHERVGNGERIDAQWLDFVDHVSEKASLEEPLQKPT